MVINIKGKSEALQDLEKAKKLIDEAGKDSVPRTNKN